MYMYECISILFSLHAKIDIALRTLDQRSNKITYIFDVNAVYRLYVFYAKNILSKCIYNLENRKRLRALFSHQKWNHVQKGWQRMFTASNTTITTALRHIEAINRCVVRI